MESARAGPLFLKLIRASKIHRAASDASFKVKLLPEEKKAIAMGSNQQSRSLWTRVDGTSLRLFRFSCRFQSNLALRRTSGSDGTQRYRGVGLLASSPVDLGLPDCLF